MRDAIRVSVGDLGGSGTEQCQHPHVRRRRRLCTQDRTAPRYSKTSMRWRGSTMRQRSRPTAWSCSSPQRVRRSAGARDLPGRAQQHDRAFRAARTDLRDHGLHRGSSLSANARHALLPRACRRRIRDRARHTSRRTCAGGHESVAKKGLASGGLSVRIKGSNLANVTAVTFGSEEASFQVKSTHEITATSPQAVGGTVDVTVTTTSGSSATSSADQFKFAPTVTALSPNGGATAGGAGVTISGSGFAPGASTTVFKFGSRAALAVNCASSTTCTVIAPAHPAGTVT